MKKFLIHVLDRTPLDSEGVKYCLGEIQIGSFKETFRMPLDFWSIEQYEEQWKEGIERLKTYDTSCLVMMVQGPGPEMQPWAKLWMIYNVGGEIYMKDAIILSSYFKKVYKDRPFTPQTCYSLISKRGDGAQKWDVDLQDLLRFVDA
ncbi:MAG TPA: hypothetical protein VGT41_03465 [Candidatus Babeliales bacterium]|nr:hypothetical protein [Candidatus Babeliales bacterium]